MTAAAKSTVEVLVETFAPGPLPNSLKVLASMVERRALAAVDEHDAPEVMVFVFTAEECVQYTLVSLQTEDFFDVTRLTRTAATPC